jgi:hypothetical protein
LVIILKRTAVFSCVKGANPQSITYKTAYVSIRQHTSAYIYGSVFMGQELESAEHNV